MTDIGIVLMVATFYVLVVSTLMYLLGYCVGRKMEKEEREKQTGTRQEDSYEVQRKR